MTTRSPRRRLISLCLILSVLAGVMAASTACAQADSPWWHLSAGARPTFLHARASNPRPPEVQEIFTEPAEFQGTPEQTNFKLRVETREVAEFITEPLCTKFCPPAVLLSAGNIQKALEAPAFYGPGGVTVEEVTTDKAGKPLENGDKRYLVTTPAPVAALEGHEEIGTIATRVSTPGVLDGELFVTAENLGNVNVSGAKESVKFKDVLPKGLKAVGVVGSKPSKSGAFGEREKIPCSIEEVGEVTTATCTTGEELAPYDQLEMRVAVDVEVSAPDELENAVSISGGGSRSASATRPVTISEAPVPYGLERYEMALEEVGGAPSLQAGTHPFQMTTTINFNQLNDRSLPSQVKPDVSAPALTKDVNVKLPPGLIGNPTPIPQCSTTQFFQVNVNHDAEDSACPPSSAVGVAAVTIEEPGTLGTVTVVLPIFNLEPRPGEPARFGFYAVSANTPVFIDTVVRTGSDYGITAEVSNVTQLSSILSSTVTFWGVPADSRHDQQRGWGCLDEARNLSPHQPCTPAGQQHPAPFLSLPTSCKAPLLSEMETDSWARPGVFEEASDVIAPERALSGCNRLQFAPEIKVAPDGQEASKPTGLTVDVHVPQEVNENAEGLASANVKTITVIFPKGVTLNPSAADGLQACSEGQVGFLGGLGTEGEFLFTPTLPEAFCPDAAKVGTFTVKSPLLPKGQNVEGALYLATPAPNGEAGHNPFNSLLALYIIAKDPVSGTLVKLPGSASLDPSTGQITSTFDNSPQLAFEDAEIHLFGGERAPLASPARCGTYQTEATFTPWSGTPPVKARSSFQITSGPDGSPCPSTPLPFGPTLTGGTTNINAGSFSPLTTTISREDTNQQIQAVSLHMPPGLSGILKGVELCPEAQANAGTCGPTSLIGHTIVSVGLGADPFSVTGGQVFFTEGYKGAPFGLSIVNPAVAGPFDLGKVIVRAKVEVDPHTTALTVSTDESGPYAIPHILDGIPLQIKHVNVLIDRPGFIFNPTSCNPQAVTGTIQSDEGASSPVQTPFQPTNCASLKFSPKFAVSTAGKTSKANGASLSVKLTYPNATAGTYANVAKVKVSLPKQLPSRLTTIQKACTAQVFEKNPTSCPKESIIGRAKVITPLLPVPLTGPVYFVSHGGEAFPDVTIVLKGYGVTVVLVGATQIRNGITTNTFRATPDAPFNSFELTFPQGKFSALAANTNLCKSKLAMPTEFTAQNGAVIRQSTSIAVTGCPKPLTKKQQLAKALKACRKRHGAKRGACEHTARRRFGSKASVKHAKHKS